MGRCATVTDQPDPTIRRVATLTLTFLLLATTVPAISLAPDIPDMAPSADAQVNCPVIGAGSAAANVSVNLTGTQTHDCPDPCNYTDCSPSTDPCDYIDCGTDPCNIVNCPEIWCVDKPCPSTDPCDHLGITPCPPSTNPCDYTGGQECPPDPNVVDLSDEIKWTTTYPESVLTVEDGYTLSGGVHNELDVPLLLNVEPHVESPSVCSVQGFSSSAKPTPRQHEYVLAPNGTETDYGTGTELLNGDSISFSVDVAVGDQTGACEVTLRATVQTIGGNDVYVGSQSMATENEEPLLSRAWLGTMAAECQTQDMVKEKVPTDPIQVEAGEVQISADLHYPGHCPDNAERGTLLVLYRHIPTTKPGQYTNVTSVERSVPGYGTARNLSVDMTQTGDYEFKVVGVYWDDWFDWLCAAAIVAVVGGAISVLASGGTSTLALYAGAVATGAGVWGVLSECEDEKEDVTSYSITVEAKEQSDAEALLGTIGGLT